ncbi:putative tripeptidyl-peptidase II [Lupinus albus]|uniref:Putative tripeptidyl-peptidase II n=1 Tax=Lupinus albus TaxID=3870 RepID=A0A6A4P5B4_LUPAL|nr:putative tripeptidyl-peptidase II [Lupinus albus]
MASNARIAVYKACWSTGCDNSDIMAAIDKAISDNVNILSLSLGTIPLDYYDDLTGIGCFAATEKGISVFAAGGNDGPNSSSVTNIAPWITTVGAGTLDREFPAYVTIGNGEKYIGASLYKGPPLLDTPLPFVYAGDVSNGEDGHFCIPDSLVPEKVKGKIVLCDRGNNSRVEKGFVVKSAGGLGMVEANTVENGQELVADPHILPALEIGARSGDALRKYLSSDPNATAKFEFGGTVFGTTPSPTVAAFSSRGPNSITPQILKPDIIGPGVNILAAWSGSSNPTSIATDPRRVDFNIISGTSMACPHLSGIAILVKSAHPDWSPAMIRSALMTTSYTTNNKGNPFLDSFSEKPATLLDYGAGHVNPVNALNPGLVYDINTNDYLTFLCALNYTAHQIKIVARTKFHCDSSKQYSVTDLNYPSFVVFFNGSTVVKHTRTLTNVGDAGTYKASIVADNPSVKISIEPEELRFDINEKKTYTITFTKSGENSHNDYDFGRLEWSNGKNVVGSPILFNWT